MPIVNTIPTYGEIFIFLTNFKIKIMEKTVLNSEQGVFNKPMGRLSFLKYSGLALQPQDY